MSKKKSILKKARAQKLIRQRIEKSKTKGDALREESTLNLRHMRYDLYLQTDHWKKTRLNALKFADHRCQMCNNPGLLNVHHRTYINRGAEKQSDLVVLCRNCHEIFHKNNVINTRKFENEQLTTMPP